MPRPPLPTSQRDLVRLSLQLRPPAKAPAPALINRDHWDR